MTDVPPGPLVVAVSGGPDSTALLIVLHEAGRDVVAAHYDHALRDGSAEVARDVSVLCERLGVPLITERRSEALPKGSLQAAARTLRYAFLERARIEAKADLVALAHIADDLVEGTALHLLRGAGLGGFRGMPGRRGRYVRPMLGAWRSDVSDFLKARGVVVHEDPANRDTRFARVRLRLLVLPALESDRPGILRRFHAAAMAVSAHHAAAVARAEEMLATGDPTRAAVRSARQPVAGELMKLMYTRAGGADPGLSRAHVAAMLRLAAGGRGGRGVDLPGGLRFRIVGEHMQVVSSRPVFRPPLRLEVRMCVGCDDRDAAHLKGGLALRLGYRSAGLRLRPLGGRGSRKLQDIFVDARVPREDRDGFPLVFAGEKLAWVPGLAVDADLAGRQGEPGLHVAIRHRQVPSASKLVRLNPKSPRAAGARNAQELAPGARRAQELAPGARRAQELGDLS